MSIDAPPPPFDKGDRIRLVSMPFDPEPIPVGSQGTVTGANYAPMELKQGRSDWQVFVKWDSGRTLSLTIPPDRAVKIGRAA